MLSPRKIKLLTYLNYLLRRDLSDIKAKQKILVKGDKSRRIFLVPKDEYVKDMKAEISKKYKKGDRDMVLDVNREAAKISSKLEVADRIDALPESEAFLSFKDHKPNFPMRKEVRLLNPSKSNIGKISKKFLDRINTDLRQKTQFNQWKSTNECLSWFRALETKPDFRFVKMDIQQFYSEIGLKFLGGLETTPQSQARKKTLFSIAGDLSFSLTNKFM